MLEVASTRSDVLRTGQKRRAKLKKLNTSFVSDLLEKHRCEKPKDDATRALIRRALENDPACAALETPDIDMIVEAMVPYSFKAGSMVLAQGDPGSHFFVAAAGAFNILSNGKTINSLGPGTAFGGLALMYDCARTVSVQATADAEVWGASGDTFRKALKESTMKKASENQQFLDSIQFFDGLSAEHKQRLGQIALYVMDPDPGTRVVNEGEEATAVYFVKKGTLSAMAGGTPDENGKLVGATKLSTMKAGDSFGERAVLYGDPWRSCTVIAEEKCELICVGIPALKEALGGDLMACLEQIFVMSGFRQSSEMSQFSNNQQHTLMSNMETLTYKAGEPIGSASKFGIILSGTVIANRGGESGEEVTFGRGELCETSLIVEAEGSAEAPEAASWGAFAGHRAGAQGARLKVLTSEGLTKGLEQLKMTVVGNTEDKMQHARKLLMAKKVPIFHHLSGEQIDQVVGSFSLQRFGRGAPVVEQGEVGTTFFVVAEGHLEVLIDGAQVRCLRKNAHFGERALLFNETRSATVRVLSESSELWVLDKTAFEKCVTGNIRERLVQRTRLENTSVRLKDIVHERLVGAGSFGSVRSVSHRFTHLRYALKRVKLKGGVVPAEVKLECELLRELNHPFIIQMVKTFEVNHSVYILTELITGGELFAAMRTIPTVFSRTQAQFYIGALVLVLQVLQDAQIVYRDLKPENVMLDEQGYIKLIDFGIAKKLDGASGRTFSTVGTVHYMAPEVMRGKGYGLECDVWSLGVVLFELVCGFLPFGNDLDDASSICTTVLSDKVDFGGQYKDAVGRSVLNGMLTKKPYSRLGSGLRGLADLRSHDYFKIADGSLFDKIIGRELKPPVMPTKEVYADAEDMEEVSLSDAGLLCNDDN